MAGVTLTLEGQGRATRSLRGISHALSEHHGLLESLGEALYPIHRQRFQSQRAPDGTPWAPLSPGYLKRKRKNRDKILTHDGTLRSSLRYQIFGDDLLFGSNLRYAAIQQLGGEIERASRQSTVYFRQGRDGSVGNRFVKRAKSNFAQDVTIGAHKIRIPARPYLGLNEANLESLSRKVVRYLRQSLAANDSNDSA